MEASSYNLSINTCIHDFHSIFLEKFAEHYLYFIRIFVVKKREIKCSKKEGQPRMNDDVEVFQEEGTQCKITQGFDKIKIVFFKSKDICDITVLVSGGK